MDSEQLRKMAKDKSIPDKKVLGALKDFLTDKKNAYDNLVALTEKELKDIQSLGQFMRKKRPVLMARLEKQVIAQHKNCCLKP